MNTKPTTQVFLYDENPISFQMGEDTMINATQMAKPFGKKPVDYLKLTSTQELIEACVRKNHTSENQLVTKKMGSSENGGGTWMHEIIAIDFAQWLNVDFRLWVNDRIKELLRFGLTATDEMLVKAATDPEFVMMMIEHLKEKRKKNIELTEINSALMAQIAEDASKVDFFNNVKKLNEHDEKRKTFPISKIANMLKLSAPALNRILIRKGVISKINGHMHLSDKYKDCGYARERVAQSRRLNEDTDEFETMDVTYLVWTQAGREFIINFLSELKK